jgi:hypothetical protein
MSDSPSREHNAAAPAHEAHSAANDYEQSARLANEKTTQCEKLLTFARFIRDQAKFSLRSAGQHPSNEDKDGLRGLKQQWQDLLNNKMLGGAGDVLTEGFRDEAQLELDKLDQTDTAATQARVGWQKVVSLIQDCQEVKQEVEQLMVKMQALLS